MRGVNAVLKQFSSPPPNSTLGSDEFRARTVDASRVHIHSWLWYVINDHRVHMFPRRLRHNICVKACSMFPHYDFYDINSFRAATKICLSLTYACMVYFGLFDEGNYTHRYAQLGGCDKKSPLRWKKKLYQCILANDTCNVRIEWTFHPDYDYVLRVVLGGSDWSEFSAQYTSFFHRCIHPTVAGGKHHTITIN